MFGLQIGLQLASLAILIIISIAYFSNKRLRLLSDRCFTMMLIFSIINLCFDILTVYTVSNVEVVGAEINHLAHQFFIGSMDTLMLFFFLYVEFLGNVRKRPGKIIYFIAFVPYAISMIMVVFGNLYYQTDVAIPYSYGPMVYTIYACVTIYILTIYIETFRYRSHIESRKVKAIQKAAYVWVVACIVQGLYPQTFLSGLAITIMILFIYVSFENRQYYIEETSLHYNKKAFHAKLNEMIAREKSFKIVNIVINDISGLYNQIGREEGNLVLNQVYDYLDELYDTDIFLSRSNVISVFDVNNHKEELFDRFNQPWLLNNQSLNLNIYFYELDYIDDQMNYDDILNIMNYISNNTYRYPIDSVIEVNEKLLNQLNREETIKRILLDAIMNDGFYIVIQPIYDINNQKFNSGEVLVRIKDDQTLGYISPDEFITIAEDNNIIHELDMIVFNKMCQFIKEHFDELGLDYLEINLSGKQIVSDNITKELYDCIYMYNIDPKTINLEITETVAVKSQDIVYENMNRLKNLGFNFSLDDFGTGYSNIARVASSNYDIIKIDKSLITPCFTDNNHNANMILKNVITLIQDVGIKILCEGIETKEQFDLMKKYHVNYIQGFYFSKPLKEIDFIDFIKTNQEL